MASRSDTDRALAAANTAGERPAARTAATLGAVVGWAALALQLALVPGTSAANGTPLATGVVRYASYFTILTNLLVALAYTARALPGASRARRLLTGPSVAGALATYIAVVGLVYFLVLRHTWNPQGAAFVADVLLHYVVPVGYVLFWLVWVRHGRLSWASPLVWLAYPAAYMLYTVAHGAAGGWYPYPFVDVGALGYAGAGRNAVALLVAFWVLGTLLVAVDRMLGGGRSGRRR